MINFQRVNNPKKIARDKPITNIIPRITTIIFFANSSRNIIPKNATKHHQKLNPVRYEVIAITASPSIHLTGELFIILFILGTLKD